MCLMDFQWFSYLCLAKLKPSLKLIDIMKSNWSAKYFFLSKPNCSFSFPNKCKTLIADPQYKLIPSLSCDNLWFYENPIVWGDGYILLLVAMVWRTSPPIIKTIVAQKLFTPITFYSVCAVDLIFIGFTIQWAKWPCS